MSGKMGDLKSRLLFLVGALIVFRIGSFIPVPGIDPVVQGAAGRHIGHVQYVLWWRAFPILGICARDHAVHFRVDHHAVDDRSFSHARSAQKRG